MPLSNFHNNSLVLIDNFPHSINLSIFISWYLIVRQSFISSPFTYLFIYKFMYSYFIQWNIISCHYLFSFSNCTRPSLQDPFMLIPCPFDKSTLLLSTSLPSGTKSNSGLNYTLHSPALDLAFSLRNLGSFHRRIIFGNEALSLYVHTATTVVLLPDLLSR